MDLHTTHLMSEVGGLCSGYDRKYVAIGVRKWSDCSDYLIQECTA
jgi:hypothetical protein